jgi:hypothetical protein
MVGIGRNGQFLPIRPSGGGTVRKGRNWSKWPNSPAPNAGLVAGNHPPSRGRGIPASGSGAFPDYLQNFAPSTGRVGDADKTDSIVRVRAHVRAIKADTTNATPNATSTRGCAWPSVPRCSTQPNVPSTRERARPGGSTRFNRPFLAASPARARETHPHT